MYTAYLEALFLPRVLCPVLLEHEKENSCWPQRFLLPPLYIVQVELLHEIRHTHSSTQHKNVTKRTTEIMERKVKRNKLIFKKWRDVDATFVFRRDVKGKVWKKKIFGKVIKKYASIIIMTFLYHACVWSPIVSCNARIINYFKKLCFSCHVEIYVHSKNPKFIICAQA